MKEFHCRTLVPGCKWHTAAEDEAEVVKRVVDHLKGAHGEAIVRENMIENIKARIEDTETAL